MCRTGRITRALVLLVAAAGCVPFSYPTNVPPEDVRASLGHVGIVVSPTAPELDLRRPPRGPIRGLGVGFVRGVLGAPVFALWAGGHGVDPLSQALFMVVGAVVYPPVSIVGGAVTAPSAASVDRASRALSQAHAEHARPERVGTLFLGLAQSLAARPCADGGFATAAKIRDGRLIPAIASADSIVVLTWTEVASTWTLGLVSTDKPCSVVTELEMHVFRASDRALVYHTRVGHMEPRRERTYRAWAFADATPLADEIDRSLDEMCTALVERLFLLAPDLHKAQGAGDP